MWTSKSIKRSSLKIICSFSKPVWHYSTEMLNLVCVVPAHRGRLFSARALAHSARLGFQLGLCLPYALIMSRGVKLRVNRANKTSPQLCLQSHSISRPALPSRRTRRENLLFTGDEQQKHYDTHICIYISAQIKRGRISSKRLALRLSECLRSSGKSTM